MKKIIFKGRLGPGQAIAVDLIKGSVYDSKSLKNKISKDYKKYSKQIIDLDKKFHISKEKYFYKGDELRRRQFIRWYEYRRFRTHFTSYDRGIKRSCWFNGR